MATVEATPKVSETVADLLERLGNVPAARVLLHPPPGTATEEDVVAYDDHKDRLCELIDGVLVEKAMGRWESILTVVLCGYLRDYLRKNNIGTLLGPDGMFKILPNQVRLPDIAFVLWERFPGTEELPRAAIPRIAPDLAVEILSEYNTPGEMQKKLSDYFEAGVRLVWYIDPEEETVGVYRSPADPRVLTAADVLSGEDVLPGFELSVRQMFDEAQPPRR